MSVLDVQRRFCVVFDIVFSFRKFMFVCLVVDGEVFSNKTSDATGLRALGFGGSVWFCSMVGGSDTGPEAP